MRYKWVSTMYISAFALCFYRPQRSWSKVIFSQASVILSTGGVCSLGVSAWGLSAPAGAWWRPLPGTTTAVGGTHPTGKHSGQEI